MINGHGDDLFNYVGIKSNFSSNTYNFFCHDGLYRHLNSQMATIAHYPESDAASLEEELTKQWGLCPGELMVTNGATEAIYLIAQAYRNAVSAIVGPTFSEYADACRLHRHTTIQLDGFDGIDGSHQLVWICNPNNPTGKVFPIAELEAVIANFPHTLFVIDCSYAPFSHLPQIDSRKGGRFPNVLLLHSMTKRFAIPGLRLGCISGNRALLGNIRAQRMPWSVNQLAICAGQYLLAHQNEYRIDLANLQDEVRFLTEALNRLGGFEVLPTDCHFMLVRCGAGTAKSLKEYLATQCGILIRDASNFEGLDASYFRIAAQSHNENEQLVKCIEQWKNSL